MNKVEFLKTLELRLENLDENEKKKTLSYYEEAILDRMEDGLSEEEAVKSLGSIEEILGNLVTPSKKEVKSIIPESKSGKIIFYATAVIWGPLAFAGISLVFSFYIVLYSLGLVVAVSTFSSGIGGLALIISSMGFFVTKNFSMAFGNLGIGLLLLGVATLLVILTNYTFKWLIKITKDGINKGKKIFRKLVGKADE